MLGEDLISLFELLRRRTDREVVKQISRNFFEAKRTNFIQSLYALQDKISGLERQREKFLSQIDSIYQDQKEGGDTDQETKDVALSAGVGVNGSDKETKPGKTAQGSGAVNDEGTSKAQAFDKSRTGSESPPKNTASPSKGNPTRHGSKLSLKGVQVHSNDSHPMHLSSKKHSHVFRSRANLEVNIPDGRSEDRAGGGLTPTYKPSQTFMGGRNDGSSAKVGDSGNQGPSVYRPGVDQRVKNAQTEITVLQSQLEAQKELARENRISLTARIVELEEAAAKTKDEHWKNMQKQKWEANRAILQMQKY